MALGDKRQELSAGKPMPGPSRAVSPLRPAPPKAAPPPPKDTSIFGGKPYVPIQDIKNRWRGPSSQIPGTSRLLSQEDRFAIAERLQKECGSYFKQTDIPKVIRKLELEKSGKSPQESARIDDQIKWLKEESGNR